MEHTFYIDESGNTGSNLFDNAQPYFASGGILLNSSQEEDLANLIEAGRKTHKIQGNELKATNLYKSKDRFIKEIFNHIKKENIPIFGEVVDKKHFIAGNIVTQVGAGKEFLERGIYSRGDLILQATLLSSGMDDTLKNYVKITKEPTRGNLNNFFSSLNLEYRRAAKELKNNYLKELSKTNINIVTLYMERINLNKKIDYFYKVFKNVESSMKSRSDEDIDLIIPREDKSKRGTKEYLLPNISSIENIIARMNKYSNITNTKIHNVIHDEQKDFDEIFLEYFNNNKNYPNNKGLQFPESNYNFSTLNLTFQDSKKSTGLQVADIISGVLFNFYRDVKNGKVNDKYRDLFKDHILQNNSTGFPNIIPVTSMLDKMYFDKAVK